jgi:hypothetical protein
MLKMAKILSAIFYLFIIIPGPKISVPIGCAMVILPVLAGNIDIGELVMILLVDLAFIYLLVSALKKNISSYVGTVATLSAIMIFIIFLLIHLKNFLNYGTAWSLLPIGAWLTAATCCVYAVFRSRRPAKPAAA